MKQATSIDEQLEKLKSRGMLINDQEKAREELLDIGYYRLGFYCFPFEKTYPQTKDRTHEYKKGTSLENCVKLYYFDFNLRSILMKYINRIEINFRTYLTYTISNNYKDSPTWFVNPLVVNKSYVDSFPEKVYNDKFKKNPVIKRHHTNHINDRYAPAWKTIEYMTFGSVLTLYEALISYELKEEIANHFEIKNINVFINYMDTIRYIRNICAHGGVLFDIKLPKSIKRGPAKINKETSYHQLDGILIVIDYMISKISQNRANDLKKDIYDLYNKYPEISQVLNEVSGLKNSKNKEEKKLDLFAVI
jgi:abortive infection bacteriophage resistance protein